MKSRELFIIFFCILTLDIGKSATAQAGEVAAEKTEMRDSLAKKWNDLKDKASREINAPVKLSSIKQVKKGAIPELVLKNKSVFFDGKELRFGNLIESWKGVIPGRPRCFQGRMTLCIWDDLGIEVGTGNENSQRVKFINIHLRFADDEKIVGNADFPDGKPAEKVENYNPTHIFPGYLELNGFGINAESRFRDIRSGADENKQLHCGSLDCSNPSGPFGEKLNIYLTLEGRSDNGRLQRMGISVVDE